MAEEIALEPDDPQPESESDRLAQPVDSEQPPRLPFPVVGVGASAGGLEAFSEFLDVMPPDGGMAFVYVLHLPPDADSHLAEVLGRRTAMPVLQVADGTPIEPNHVFVIRPGHVLTIRDGVLHLGPELGGPRAANRPIDDLFRSLAEEQRERAVCVLLSGMGSNGTAGAQAIKAVGGLCIAQDPESAAHPSMPRHLIDAGYADYVVRPPDLPEVLLSYARSRYATGGREEDAQVVLNREGQHLREILAVLRTRTKHDFTGYKKPTILRRVQRRMGLVRQSTLAEYARHLRQSPSEVAALADDLLIHVTGFFRDQEAWEALRVKVVVPLVAARETGEAVRAWVTACSSGEEAYSLAMLLAEEAERVGKRLDIKVFATDLADSTLAHARAGVYPGGIESEISPDRLSRFFARESEVYRVRQDLRDLIVFAPQDVLQDPPFSRLDIATCRNLLIYLKQPVQQRVLNLLHFGLREGGALFLGTSETISGAEELFVSLDKKARIYRRVGPTRHGLIDFPSPRSMSVDDGRAHHPPAPRRLDPARNEIAEQTRRVLLEWHTPPAVTVDRDYRVLFFHGNTSAFLRLPAGEMTRDIFLLAREGLRGVIRTALNRAAAKKGRVTTDGWMDREGERKVQVSVTATPLADAAADRGAPDQYVLSFEQREESDPAAAVANQGAADHLSRLEEELQSTIEELQSSNEELKASNEEVMSVNEELQSANEELETSKEEMQSLNEELRTVNTQLRLKMEEHQAASSDLSSLLASTDIAVLFLDPQFRIRRFTPAIRDLVDLIPSDVGRPLTALARKFDDSRLDVDCMAVLERLVPLAREVSAASGRHYLRRVLPYRTTDNRIDGVVVTFVDITDRKRAEEALRTNEERFRLTLESATDFAIITLDPDRKVASWSPGAATAFGYGPDEIVGQSADVLFTPEDRAAGAPEAETEAARRDGRAADERWHVRKDGTRFFASGVLTPLGADAARGFVKVARDLTERKRMEDALRRANNELEARVKERTAELEAGMVRRRDLARRLGTAQEDERQRVARDFHDAIGQLIAGLSLAFKAIENAGTLPPLAATKLTEAQAISSAISKEVHSLAVRLRPTSLDDIGLEAALGQLVNEWSSRTGVKGVFHAAGINSGRLPADVETAVYRIVQEALTNITKHARATAVSVVVSRPEGFVSAVIEDNGAGFDVDFASNGRIGLLGMRERVELLGGTIDIDSTPGAGTTIAIQIPLNGDAI